MKGAAEFKDGETVAPARSPRRSSPQRFRPRRHCRQPSGRRASTAGRWLQAPPHRAAERRNAFPVAAASVAALLYQARALALCRHSGARRSRPRQGHPRSDRGEALRDHSRRYRQAARGGLSADHGLDQGRRHAGALCRPASGCSPADDPLVPVELRQGERSLGGALSWSEPQPLAAFPEKSPFAGLPKPDGVTVTRQVLANPSPTLAEHTWASLADGTPLVTAKKLDAGQIVLFHTSADTSWSNLALSAISLKCSAASRRFPARMADRLRHGRNARALPPAQRKRRADGGNGGRQTADGRRRQGTNTQLRHAPRPLRHGRRLHRAQSLPPRQYARPTEFRASGPLRDDGWPRRLGHDRTAPRASAAAFLLLVADSIAVFVMGGAFSGLFQPSPRRRDRCHRSRVRRSTCPDAA